MLNEQNKEESKNLLRFTYSPINQGKYKFYSLTLNIDLLARTCFVSTRDEDPIVGFQRLLDEKRAKQIAEYIDSDLGTIPIAIVLSAQPESELKIIKGGKIIEFADHPKSFLILDGQHRVYGFSLAKTKLRVPVIIYSGLNRQDESRLFIDINTKQRPVPNELLLDIKKLAARETDIEERLREIFDLFNTKTNSPLLGKLSSDAPSKNKLTRVTFNTALKPLINAFQDKDVEEIYEAIRAYIAAFVYGMNTLEAENSATKKIEDSIIKPIVFRAVMQLFNDIGQRVKDKYDSNYTVDNFYEMLKPIFDRASVSWFSGSKITINGLYKKLKDALQTNFTL